MYALTLLQFIGSSLLFIHDSDKVGVWLIDFGKTVPLPPGVTIDHQSVWEVGNHEDGYKIGIENLIELFQTLANTLRDKKGEKHKGNNNDQQPRQQSTKL